jgi:hypothetical protein
MIPFRPHPKKNTPRFEFLVNILVVLEAKGVINGLFDV